MMSDDTPKLEMNKTIGVRGWIRKFSIWKIWKISKKLLFCENLLKSLLM